MVVGSLAVLLAVVVALAGMYQVNQTERVILTQFGKPVGGIIDEAGLHFKIPFVQRANFLERRILEWDGTPNDMPTKDKLYIMVDTFGRWRINDPQQYFLRLRDERSAQSRLDDKLGSETRNAVAKHELIELVRTTKGRTPDVDPMLAEADIGMLLPIHIGRRAIEKDIIKQASAKLAQFGIQLLDVRFKRINYNESVRQKIYQRMISERQQIAERFRSEGAGEAARIKGKRQRDVQQIESVAYKTNQEIQGKADARATDIYAQSYDQSPAAADLYTFVKTLETYRKAVDSNTTLILSTNSDLYALLKHVGTDR